MEKRKMFLLFMLWLLWPAAVSASPPPEEIAKAKAEAPVHLIGVVTSERLHQDVTKEDGDPVHIRRITLSVQRVVKAPPRQTWSEATVYYVSMFLHGEARK